MDTSTIIKRAAEKGGFIRTRYEANNIPTSLEQICIMCLFPDLRGTFLASALLLKRFRQEIKGSKYFILVSWPNHEGFYPYVDEYWTLKEEGALQKLHDGIKGFQNTSAIYTLGQRHLNGFFEDNIDSDVLGLYYNRGLTTTFLERFSTIEVFLPTISSSVAVGPEFNRTMNRMSGFKVFIYPEKTLNTWVHNQEERVNIPKDFWIGLCERLVKEGYRPVVYRDLFAYDISTNLTDQCIHLKEQQSTKLLGVMRACGCVMDLFSGISRLAIAARCPFIVMDERARYVGLKEYEIDDLSADRLPKDYIFTFSTIIRSGDLRLWKVNVYDPLIARLNRFVGIIDPNTLPSTSEENRIVTYDQVRKRKIRRLGTRFIKLERNRL